MREGAQNRYRCRCLTPRPVHAYSLYRICCYWFHSASGFMQMLPLPLPLATTSLVGLNIFLCFASFLSFSFFCFVTASAAFPWFWRSMSESFPWAAAAAASQVHVMLLHSCERALLLLLQQSRAFMPLAFWKLDRITIILLDLKVTFRKWVEWVRKRRHKQTTQTNRPLGFSRESDQIWHFHCCFVFSRAINEFQWKRGLHFNEDYHIQTDTQTM